MKVRVLKPFFDKYTGEKYTKGKELDITKERFEEILTVDKLVEEIKVETVKEEPKVVKQTKRKSK